MAFMTRLDTSQVISFGSGTSESNIIDLGMSGTLEAIHMPDTWTTGNLTFRVSLTEDGTFRDMYDADGNIVTVCLAASTYVTLNGLVTKGMRFVQFVSTSNQAAPRTIQAYIRNEI